MSRVVWSPERGWHDDGAEVRLVLDSRGRIRWVPADGDPKPDSEQA
jgi:hypothetical protein